MIVTIAAWLYIVQAALGLTSLTLSPFGFSASMANIATLAVSLLIGAMGIGLLKRDPRARWLALGSSLLGWTLGTLALLGVIAALFMLRELTGGIFAGGFGSIIGFIALLFFVVLVVSIVVSFKLFWHLCSQEGCEEFGVQYGSAGTVVASVGTWIAIAIAQFVMSGGGMMSMIPTGGSDVETAATLEGYEEPDEVSDEAALSVANEQAERERIEAERLAEFQAYDNAASQAAANGQAGVAVEEAPVPTFGGAGPVSAAGAEAEEEDKPSTILKCRDSSGNIQYTQGYCPPGTKRIDMPKTE